MSMMPTTHRSHRMRQYRTMLVLGAVVVAVYLAWLARGAMFPFYLGLAISYLLLPVVNFVQRLIPPIGFLKRIRRTLAVLLVYVAIAGVITVVAMTVGSAIVTQVLELSDNLPGYVDDIKEEYDYWVQRYENDVPADVQETIESNVDAISAMIGTASQTILTTTFGTLRRFLGFMTGLILLPLWVFYVLKDQQKAMSFFYRLWPANLQDDVREVVHIVDRILAAYIRGQLFLGFVVGGVTYAGLWFLDVEYAVPLALLAGLFEMVPIIGPWISFIAAAIVVLATHPEQIWAVAILFLAIQQLENTLLVPKIQGDAVDMNPAVIMVLLVVGGALFGFLGIIVIVPVAAIVRDVFLYAYRRLSEEAELPETPV